MPATGATNLMPGDRGTRVNKGTDRIITRSAGSRKIFEHKLNKATGSSTGKYLTAGSVLKRLAADRKARVASAKPKPYTDIQRAANARRAAAGFARSKAQAAERKRRK